MDVQEFSFMSVVQTDLSYVILCLLAVLDEDYEQFKVEVLVGTDVTADGNSTVCTSNLTLGILNDDIVEGDQTFSLKLTGMTLAGGAILDQISSLDVVIMDDSNCEYYTSHFTHITHPHTPHKL